MASQCEALGTGARQRLSSWLAHESRYSKASEELLPAISANGHSEIKIVSKIGFLLFICNSRNKFGVWITGWLPWFGQGKEKKVEKLEVSNRYVLLDPFQLFRLFFLPWWLSLSYLVVLTIFVCIPFTNERWIGWSKLKVNHVTSFRPWSIWISVLSKYYLLNNSVTS